MNYKGTTGNDDYTGTNSKDVFYMQQGGSDAVDGGGGNDSFRFGGTFDTSDKIDGGTGADTLILDGDYVGLTFLSASMLTNVETIQLSAGHNYNFAIFDGVIAHGAGLSFKAGDLGAGDFLTVDGSYLSASSADTVLTVYGGAGTTFFTGGTGTNLFHGGGSNDFVYFGGNWGHDDGLDGGGGSNTLQLTGDYSAGLNVTATMMRNFSYLTLEAGYDYKLVLSDGNVAAGQTLQIFADLAPGDGHNAIVNGSHEKDGHFYFYDGGGNDVFYGGAQRDVIDGGTGGNEKFYGNGGDDIFTMNDKLTASDHIDGGDGTDEIELAGDYSHGLALKATTVVDIETIFLGAGHSYKIVMNDANVAAGHSMELNGDTLFDTDTLTADASAETDGHYYLGGGAGDDTLIGGQAGNTFYGSYGQDHLTAGAGADVFQYLAIGESLGADRDIITGFDALHDSFDIPPGISVDGIDMAVTSGTLNEGHFTGGLAAVLDAAHLEGGHAVLFTPDHGNLAGHTFLIVDGNGVAGYQAAHDFVFQLDGATNLGDLSLSDFI